MADGHKIKVKFGDMEFEAEGDQSVVEEQFRIFMETVSAGVSPAPKHTTQNEIYVRDNISDTDHVGGVNKALIERTFLDKGGVVSLKVLPQKSKSRSSDSLMLLLYGYYLLHEDDNVLATQLMKAARQSGLPIDRIDRFLTTQKDFVGRGGSRRSTRYSLNNRGLTKAKELLEGIHE